MPKLEKFLLLTSVFTGLLALLIISAAVTTGRMSFTYQAQTPTQTVRSWIFKNSRHDWKVNSVKSTSVKNGSWNINIGKSNSTPLIFNRKALTKLTADEKFAAINFSIEKNQDSKTNQTSPSTTSTTELSASELQVMALPVAPKPTDSGGYLCTADALACPDGSYVSRVPPKCDFAPCPPVGFPTFLFNLYYKKLTSNAWFGPVPFNGIISPKFQEFFVRLPEKDVLTLEALKIEFSEGLSDGDIVKIKSISLAQSKLPPVTPGLSPGPTISKITPLPHPTVDPDNCINPPPCYYGLPDGKGKTRFCLIKPSPDGIPFCPRPTSAITPFLTCRPRPACLDTYPVICEIVETPDMCPPPIPQTTKNPGPEIDVPPPRYEVSY